MDYLRTYPDLNQYCLGGRLDLQLRLWYLLRQNQLNGRGWLTLDDVYRLSCGNRRQTRTWLKSGLGTFWTVDDRGRYWLAGLGTLVERLAVKLPKPVVAIPRGDIENLAQFRAALFASWFVGANDDGVTIGQATLAELFGRTPRTLRTWTEMAGLGVVHNMALAPIPKPGDDLDRYPNGTLEALRWGKTWLDDPNQKPNLVWFERHDDNLMLTWRIVNTYVMAGTPGPKTTLQKRASRRAPALRGEGANAKRYYRKDAKGGALAKAIQRGGPVYWETGAIHPKTGDKLWSKLA